MAETKIRPIYGQKRGHFWRRKKKRMKEYYNPRRKNFIFYDPNNKETTTEDGLSVNFVDLIGSREYGGREGKVAIEYGTKRIIENNLHKETTISLGEVDKIFCSAWLNERQVAFGTKCNKLMVLDTVSLCFDQLPTLKPSSSHEPGESQTGIHSLKINPSNTMMATGADHTNALGFYRLPTLEPVTVGEFGHKDCVFDMEWLDDEFLVSGSRDNTVALWKVRDNPGVPFKAGQYTYTEPLCIETCQSASKVRAVTFNRRKNEIGCLSLNSFIHLWDPLTFQQTYSKQLEDCAENVCLMSYEDVYVVGCKPYLLLVDSRTLATIRLMNLSMGEGIRSLSLHGNLLSIGSSSGYIRFFDMRAREFLADKPTRTKLFLRASVSKEAADFEMWSPLMGSLAQGPAIYTHCYDSSGTRLFSGGGPIAMQPKGHYAALWT